eukprot:COSAG02_NODE_287_length_25647_cov_245.259316_22_plen_62_part_00
MPVITPRLADRWSAQLIHVVSIQRLTIDAGLTVHGAGYLSYPGEGLVKDGLSYMANTVHNI